MACPDYPVIKERYKKAYAACLNSGRKHIQEFIEDWPSILTQMETIIYQEIRTAGALLYPIYPVENVFVNFGNPFYKLGIEIFYKTNGQKEKQAKLDLLKEKGWTIYTFETKYISFVLEDLFNHVSNEYNCGCFEELDQEEKDLFIERYKAKNLECLVYHIISKIRGFEVNY